VKRRLLLDVVVAQRAAVFELLASKAEAQLVSGNALLVLDLALERLDENLPLFITSKINRIPGRLAIFLVWTQSSASEVGESTSRRWDNRALFTANLSIFE